MPSRATPLASTAGLYRSAPLRHRAPRRAGQAAAETRTRRLVAARSGGWCEIRIPGTCGQRATNMHHRRRAGRVWAPSNVLHLCGSGSTRCHGAVTNTNGRRAEYEQAGWIVPSHRNPASVPVLLPAVGVVLLDDDGGWTLADGGSR